MISDSDKKVVREEIAPLLQDGDLTLYLGAGVSVDTETINGLGVPSSRELIKRICRQVGLDDAEADQADLPTAFGVGEIEIENFENFLIGNFTISKPFPWQVEIFKHWWRAIFTTNIDDLALKCVNILKTELREFPEYAIYNYREREPVTSLSITPPVVHLHGSISRPEQGFVFDAVSYADVTIKSNEWINKSALHISHGQCVFVGSKFKESDIEAAIRQRTLWTDSSSEKQPRNWIVLKKFTALERRAYEKRGITPIEATAEEFFAVLFASVQYMTPAKFLKRKAPYLRVDKANPAMAWFSTNMASVAAEAEKAKHHRGPLSRFYFGDMPDWYYVASDVPAYFGNMLAIRNEVLAFEGSGKNALLISVTGALGSGKTTSCMMALFELSQTHGNVYMFSGLNALEIEHAWRVIKDMKGLVVIFVDSASSAFYAINDLIKRVHDKSTSCKLCFLAEERTVQFRRSHHHLSGVPKEMHKVVEINNLSREDAYSLYDKANSLGITYDKLENLSRDAAVQKIVDFDSGYKGDLLATLYDLSSSKSYQEKLAEEFAEIRGKNALGVFQTLSIVTASRLAMPINYLAETQGVTINALMELLEKELKGKVYLNRLMMTVSARHHSIAEYHIGNSFDKNDTKDRILALMECVASKFIVDDIKHHPISYKIYSKTLSQNFLTETVFPNESLFPLVEEIYSKCQRFFALDGIFWLQYGRFLEKTRNIEDALHCFKKGLALFDSFQIRHALGQVLIKRYRLSVVPNKQDLDEGVELLKLEIDRRGSGDSYPYTALGNELIRLSKSGRDREFCLSTVKEIINRGLTLHKDDEVFMNMVKRYLQVSDDRMII